MTVTKGKEPEPLDTPVAYTCTSGHYNHRRVYSQRGDTTHLIYAFFVLGAATFFVVVDFSFCRGFYVSGYTRWIRRGRRRQARSHATTSLEDFEVRGVGTASRAPLGLVWVYVVFSSNRVPSFRQPTQNASAQVQNTSSKWCHIAAKVAQRALHNNRDGHTFFPGFPSTLPTAFPTFPATLSFALVAGAFSFLTVFAFTVPPVAVFLVVVALGLATRPLATFLSRGLDVLAAVVRFLVAGGAMAASILTGILPVFVRVVATILDGLC